MSKKRDDEKFWSLGRTPISSVTGSQSHHLLPKNGGRQDSNSVVGAASPNKSENIWSSSQYIAGLSTPSLSSAVSLEPYVSVGCLKCGASDHVATNRNCPRPRKTTTVTYATPTQTPVAKKNLRSPKKPTVDKNRLGAAKIGDDNKFWYYISDDSEDGKQGDSNTGEQIEKDEVNQDQSSNAANLDFFSPSDDEPRIVLGPIDEQMQPDLSSRSVVNKGAKLRKGKPVKTSRGSDKLAQTVAYGALIESIGASQLLVPYGQPEAQGQASQRLSPRNSHDDKGLGSIRSLPWMTSATSPLPPMKHSIPSPINIVKATKATKQRKAYLNPPTTREEKGYQKPEASSQKQPRKVNQTLHMMPMKARVAGKPQKGVDPVDVCGMAHLPCYPHQPTLAQPDLVQSSRYPTEISKHSKVHTNHTPPQRIYTLFPTKKAETTRFKYNYMGSRNTVQAPRVRYAANRVQGWRECRSMGTGLE